MWNLQLRVTAITFFWVLPLFFFLFFSSRVQKGLLLRLNSVEPVSSMSIKLLPLFYHIPEKTSVTVLDFRNAKQQMPNETHDWTLIGPLRFFKLSKNQSFETNSSSENLRALDFNTLRGEPLDLVGGGWSQALSMYFFFRWIRCAWFFWEIRCLQDFLFWT